MTLRVFSDRRLLILVFFLLATLASSARAQSGQVTPAEFWRLIETAHEILSSEETPFPETLADLSGELASITSVQLPNGASLAVDTRYLARLLSGDQADPDRARAVLEAALALRAQETASGSGEAELQVLTNILAAERFQWATTESENPLTALWQHFLNWLARLLADLWPGAGVRQVLNILAAGLITVILAIILRFVYLNAMRSVVQEAGLDAMAGVAPGLTGDQALARARERAEAGDLRDAVRYLYLSTLYKLEENGAIRLDRAHTNRELLADLAVRSELSAGLRTVVETFDRVWYGYRPISEDEFGRFSETVVDLNALI